MKRLITRPRSLLLVVALAMVAAMCTVSTASAASSASAAPHEPAASSSQCKFMESLKTCESTDRTVSYTDSAYGNTSDCTFVFTIAWGDSSPTTTVKVTDPTDGPHLLATHRYAATPRAYTITVTVQVTAGNCTGTNSVHTFTLVPPTPSPTCPPTPQPRIYWSQVAGPQGTKFSLTGNGWYASDTVTSQLSSNGIFNLSENSWSADSSGDWQLGITVRNSARPGTYEITFTQTGCSRLQVTGHFKVTMTRIQFGELVTAIYQLVAAADEVAKVIGDKGYNSSVVHKAVDLIGKAQTVFAIGIAGLHTPAVHNDLNALIRDLKKAHNNRKNPVVQQDVRRLEADTNRLADALYGIVAGLNFVLPPPVYSK